MAKYLTLGKRANIFHDPYVGLTITKGDIKEVPDSVISIRRVKQAISSGHLVITDPPVVEEVNPVIKPEDLIQNNLEKLNALVADGKSLKEIAKAFKLDELKAMAEYKDIEVEESDTKEDILGVLVDEE